MKEGTPTKKTQIEDLITGNFLKILTDTFTKESLPNLMSPHELCEVIKRTDNIAPHRLQELIKKLHPVSDNLANFVLLSCLQLFQKQSRNPVEVSKVWETICFLISELIECQSSSEITNEAVRKVSEMLLLRE